MVKFEKTTTTIYSPERVSKYVQKSKSNKISLGCKATHCLYIPDWLKLKMKFLV